MPSRYRRNPNLEAELMRDPAMRATLMAAGRAALPAIRAVSTDLTGHYDRSLIVVEEDGEVRVGNTDVAAHLREWGSVKNPAEAPLRRGIRRAGYKMVES